MEFPDKESLKERFEQYSDEQLIDILQNQQDYQELATETAREIAMNRGLMHHLKERPNTELQNKKKTCYSIFPALNTPEQKEKVIKSLLRTFYLVTLFPLIYASLSYAAGNQINLLTFGGITILWVLFVYQTGKTKQTIYVYALLGLLLAGLLLFTSLNQISFLPRLPDMIICTLSFLLLLYLLLFLINLIKNRHN